MFDTESVTLFQKISRHSSDVTSCDISKSYTIATGSSDKTVVVYEWRQSLGFVEASYGPLKGHKYGVTCVRFSPSQSVLASASVDGHTNLWCLKTGKCLQSLIQANGNGVRVITYSLDGTLLVTAGEGGIFCLWSTSMNNVSLVRTISGHDEESIQGATISPDNMVVVTGDVTGSYKVWSVLALKDDECSFPLVTVRDAHDLGINYLDFSSQYTTHISEGDGVTERCYLLASCGNDHWSGLWQVTISQVGKGNDAPIMPSLPAPQLISKLSGHNSAILQSRISPNGDLLATASIDNTTRIWQISSGRCLKTLEGHTRYVTSCSFSEDQSLIITGSNDRSAMLWDLSGSRVMDSILPSSRSSLASSYQIDTHHDSDDGQGIQLLQKLEHHSSSVNSVHFGTEYLVSGGSDHKMVIWKWSSTGEIGECKAIEEAHRYPIHQVETCSKSGLVASCSLDGTSVLWDPETGMVKKSGWHVSGAGVRCVRFSPDSHLIAAGGDDDEVHLYRSDTCQKLATMKGDGEGVMCLSFTFDSNLLLVGSTDGHARLYCLMPTSESPVALIENCHDLGITSVDFSQTTHSQLPLSEGTYEVATCGNDCLVKVWTIKAQDYSFSLLWTLSGHGGSVTCVRYSPQLAEMIASTGTDKTCRLWDSYSGDCLHVVESHEGILTSCAFSPDATLLATGSMDKLVLVWALPKDLAFRSFIATRCDFAANVVEGWSVDNVNRWLELFNLPPSNLTGSSLLHYSIDEILEQLNIEDLTIREEVAKRIEELRKEPNGVDPPHEFFCPITHQLMRDPVIAADGESYERSAIESWFSTGRITSPMTNVVLDTIKLESNAGLRQSIANYLNL